MMNSVTSLRTSNLRGMPGQNEEISLACASYDEGPCDVVEGIETSDVAYDEWCADKNCGKKRNLVYGKQE